MGAHRRGPVALPRRDGAALLRVREVAATYRYTAPATDPSAREVLAARLVAAGADGVWERDDAVVAWFTSTDADVPPGGRWEQEPERDWLEEWKAGLEPIRVGVIVVAPPWAVPPEADAIVIDPGMAFGTGHHATTRLCLAALQRAPLAGARVLDVGTGSGVLAIAAARLGAAEVVAVDTDPDAVAAARRNVAANRATVDVRHGGLEAVTGAAREASGGRRAPPAGLVFDLVVANLLTDVVLDLAGDLLGVTAPGGTLVVSGIGASRAERVADGLERLGADVVHVDQDNGWCALVARRVAPRDTPSASA